MPKTTLPKNNFLPIAKSKNDLPATGDSGDIIMTEAGEWFIWDNGWVEVSLRDTEMSHLSQNAMAMELNSRIQFCMNHLGFTNVSSLAALINVTKRALEIRGDEKVFVRLNELCKIIQIARESGVESKILLNILIDPIPCMEDGRSLLYYVVDEPGNSLLPAAVYSVIRNFEAPHTFDGQVGAPVRGRIGNLVWRTDK